MTLFAQPQRNRCRLQGLYDASQDRIRQGVRVDFISQGMTESGEGLFGVVLLPVEAAVEALARVNWKSSRPFSSASLR
jgi:hypothetical protein